MSQFKLPNNLTIADGVDSISLTDYGTLTTDTIKLSDYATTTGTFTIPTSGNYAIATTGHTMTYQGWPFQSSYEKLLQRMADWYVQKILKGEDVGNFKG